MKLIYKERILELLETCREASQYFWKSPVMEERVELCASCQSAAVGIGESIEKNEKNPEQIILYLEEYCEYIYKLSLMEPGEEYTRQLFIIQKVIDEIEEKIKTCVSEEKTEVVFLPYKASMWDSFHSVYKAFKEDYRFQVSVVPIPYYNLNKNGSILSESYEGEEIAKYAEITDYRLYELELKHPDIVFIHNPYDNCNLVTCVKQSFFSSELIKYTDHLVYIPYYVSKKYTDDSMTILPGRKNSWRTIVQSEQIRQQHIRFGADPEQVVALGSPKFDMVVMAQQECTSLPEQWGKLKGKKIFLYNTHLSGLISNSDIFMNKIEKVADIFAQRKDIGLLWRPHPLSIETIRSFHPEQEERYLGLVKHLKQQENCICDESAASERAMALADAYIGEEGTSLSHLYRITKRPMYYMDNKKELPFQENRLLHSLCGEWMDGKLYFFGWNLNGIYIYDENREELSFEKGDHEHSIHEHSLYNRSISYQNYIYFLPKEAENVLKYDVKTGEKKYILIKENSIMHEFDPVINEGILYLMPVYYADEFPCINLQTDKVDYINTNYKNDLGEDNGVDKIQLFYGGEVTAGCIWRIGKFGPYIQKYNLKNKQIRYSKVDEISSEFQLRDLAYDGRYFWLIMQQGNTLIKWDAKKEKVRKMITIDQVEASHNDTVFDSIVYYDESVWVLPYRGDAIIKMNIDTEVVTSFNYKKIEGFHMEESEEQQSFAQPIIGSDGLYLFPYGANGILKVQKTSNQFTWIPMDYMSQMVLEKLDDEQQYSEELCTLETFIAKVMRQESCDMIQNYEMVGNKIFDYIVSQL